jgi:hypothetical protein
MAKKTLRQECYSNPLDIRIMAMNSLRKETHAGTIFLTDLMIDLFSMRAKGIIDLKLGNVMSGVTTFEVTPYTGPPLIPLPDEENTGENTGTGVMYGLNPSSSAYTELWTITFTSATAFGVVGSFSGSQGTGATSSAFTSTDSDIVIPTEAWSGTPASGDIFYVPVYKHHPSIVMLSTMLATGLIFKGQATGAAPDMNPEGAKLYDDAMKMLEDIASGDASLLGVNTLIDSSDILVPYEISYSGTDVSNYRVDEICRYISNTYATQNPWWYYR